MHCILTSMRYFCMRIFTVLLSSVIWESLIQANQNIPNKQHGFMKIFFLTIYQMDYKAKRACSPLPSAINCDTGTWKLDDAEQAQLRSLIDITNGQSGSLQRKAPG